MKKNEIESTIKNLITKFSRYNVKIDLRTDLINDVGLDSVTMTELITLIESEVEIQINDDEILPENFLTFGNLIDFLKKKSTNK